MGWHDWAMASTWQDALAADSPLARLASLRQHQHDGKRSPHKPLLVLLALGQFAACGSSELPWSVAEARLARLIAEFGPATRTSPGQRAAYPFTRLRSDGVWQLDHDVRMDAVRPLTEQQVVGRFESSLEAALRANNQRRRDPAWRIKVLQAWDEQCAFCGYDGRLGDLPIGVEAAHVRWFAHAGPDTLDNGLALCMLHHKLFDRGALGLDHARRVMVSRTFTARTEAGRTVYDLHGHELRPRPGTREPAEEHLTWHRSEVFKGHSLTS